MNRKDIIKYLPYLVGLIAVIIAFTQFKGCDKSGENTKEALSNLQGEFSTQKNELDKVKVDLEVQKGNVSFYKGELLKEQKNIKTIGDTRVLIDSILYCPDGTKQEIISDVSKIYESRFNKYNDLLKEKESTISTHLSQIANYKNQISVYSEIKLFSRTHTYPIMGKTFTNQFKYRGTILNYSEPTIGDIQRSIDKPKSKDKPFYKTFATIGYDIYLDNSGMSTKVMNRYNIGIGRMLGRRLSIQGKVVTNKSFKELGTGISLGYHFN